MNKPNSHDSRGGTKTAKWIYGVVLFFLVFSGFGQMPLYKRYYLTDIPGMKWAADFYNTHYIHYVAAILFLAFIFYKGAEYLLILRKTQRVTISGYIRAAWIAGMVLTGACLVINNFTGAWFSTGFIIFLDLAHLGFLMLMFVTAVYCKIRKMRWLVTRLG